MTKTMKTLGAALVLVGVTAFVADARPSREEREAARDAAFAQADADGNGALSPEELTTFHETLRATFEQRRFAKADADGDGQVTAEELAAAKSRFHKHRGCPKE